MSVAQFEGIEGPLDKANVAGKGFVALEELEFAADAAIAVLFPAREHSRPEVAPAATPTPALGGSDTRAGVRQFSAGDDFYVDSLSQVELPRWALKHEFLLHGIFAMSALEAAICAGPEMDEAESAMYVRAAMEYYDKGSGAFRAQLLEVSPENIHSVYMFSYMAMAINMALSQCVPDGDGNQSMIGRITVLLELFLPVANPNHDIAANLLTIAQKLTVAR